MEAKIWLHDCSVAANIRYSATAVYMSLSVSNFKGMDVSIAS